MEERIERVEKELQLIRERNVRVEAGKAWEVSAVRVISISVMIYILACLILFILHAENVFAAALLPALGYFLSTRSLSFVQKAWTKAQSKKLS